MTASQKLTQELIDATGITPEQAQALTMWAVYAMPYLKAGDTPEVALAKGRDDYEAFLLEMAQGKTRRAKMARRVLATEVYHEINHREAQCRALQDCEEIDRR